MPNTENHKWSKSDDILTYIIFRFDKKEKRYDKKKVAEVIGVKSLTPRLKNFLAIETNKQQGLPHYGKISEEVYNEFKNEKDEIKIASHMRKPELIEFYIKSLIKFKQNK